MEDEQNGGKKEKKVVLKLEEPDSHYKALMAWAVMKETWAFRPGIGWCEWRLTHWKVKTPEELEEILTRFMDAQCWKKRSSTLMSSVIREMRSRLLVRDEFWSPDNKLAFLNGTLHLDTQEFHSRHDSFERLTKVRPYNFPEFVENPDWYSATNLC